MEQHLTALNTIVARDIMTPNPICVRETDLAKDIQEFFTKFKISSVPVLNAQGNLTGIVSTADLARSKQILDMKEFIDLLFTGTEVNVQQLQEFFHLDTYEEIAVKDIMSDTLLAAYEDTPVRDMARQMFEKRIHRVIILNKYKQVVGIVSALDVVNAAYPGHSSP